MWCFGMTEAFVIWMVLLIGVWGGGLVVWLYKDKCERELSRKRYDDYCALQDKYFDLKDKYRNLLNQEH